MAFAGPRTAWLATVPVARSVSPLGPTSGRVHLDPYALRGGEAQKTEFQRAEDHGAGVGSQRRTRTHEQLSA